MQLRIDRNKLESYRMKAGLLKQELAAKARVHPAQISKVLRGDSVGVRVGRSIARAMGAELMDVAVVVGESKPEPAGAGT